MKFDRILAALYTEPWAIRPEAHASLAQVVQRNITGQTLPTEGQLRAQVTPDRALLSAWPQADIVVGPMDDDGDPLIPQMQRVGNVAVIPVFGTLGRHLSWLAVWCGGCDYSYIEQMAELAEADPNIDTIIFYFRSPGGRVTGCEECGSEIAALTKRTIAYSDVEMCSSAYWLASACDEIICSPSAIVGSIGVFIAAIDNSSAWADMGQKLELFRSGPLKAAGIAGKSWTDEERKAYQVQVDELFSAFANQVKASRPGVTDDCLKGQWMSGRAAVECSLADGLVNCLDDVVAAAIAA